MKKQIRRNVFETNSSSCHSFSQIHYAGGTKYGISEFKELANIDGIVKIDISDSLDVEPDIYIPIASSIDKLKLVIANVPTLYEEDNIEVPLTLALLKENKLVNEILDALNKASGLTFKFINTEPDKNRWLERALDVNEDLLFKSDFYYNIGLVVEFIINPQWSILSVDCFK